MKKVLLGLTLCGALLLTGCGKTLKCTAEESYFGIEAKSEVRMTFSGDKVSKVKMVNSMTVPDEYLSELDSVDEIKESLQKSYPNAKISVKRKGSTITETIEVKVSNLPADEREDYEEFKGYDDAKSQFEAEGYKCK